VGAGGALETVVEGETGVLVGNEPDELAAAMREVDFERFEQERIRAWAMQFSTERFQERLVAEVSASAAVVA
jgi:glycosyltransferase involved in cell wall biosynthesis